MEKVIIDDLVVFKFKELTEIDFVEHCFTSRIGGFSDGPYSSLKMGLLDNDIQKEATVKNIGKVSKLVFNRTMEDVVRSDQVHGINIKTIKEEDRGKGLTKERDFKDVDGLITNVAGIILTTSYADCTPLFIVDEKKKVVAAVHSGWKGTVKRIGEEAVRTMVEEYGSLLEDIKVGIGPTIGPESFEVGEEVYIAFKEAFDNAEDIVSGRKGNKYYLNLWEANRMVLEEAGLKKDNIFIDDHDTLKEEELFYSHRRDNGITGRMAAMIMIK